MGIGAFRDNLVGLGPLWCRLGSYNELVLVFICLSYLFLETRQRHGRLLIFRSLAEVGHVICLRIVIRPPALLEEPLDTKLIDSCRGLQYVHPDGKWGSIRIKKV